MKRRELIRQMALASVAASAGSLGLPMRALACDPAYPSTDRILVNLMLLGGADMRFVFMPSPDALSTAHKDLMWSARQSMYQNGYSSYDDMFNDLYAPAIVNTSMNGENSDLPGQDFGIHESCGWLRSMYDQGKVAIIANAMCSSNRRHDQSILNAEAGDPAYNTLTQDRDGWGGRVVEAIGGGANAVELGGSISVFNKSTNAANRLEQVVHAANTRNIALPNTSSGSSTHIDNVMIRALKSYYAGRAPEVAAEKSADWPFHPFFNHNASLRAFGDSMDARMGACGPFPADLRRIGENVGTSLGTFDLASYGFETQCRNLYDVCQAADILNVRTVNMSYGGWDTHGDEEGRIGRNLGDIFGTDMGLDRVMREIANMPAPSNAAQNIVIYVASDFGRQLVCNGDLGTDHGKGIYSLLIGDYVQGGAHGRMFPESETLHNGSYIPLERHGADITGLTSTERILAEISEWMHTGSSSTVVPNAGGSILEPGVNLDNLLKESLV